MMDDANSPAVETLLCTPNAWPYLIGTPRQAKLAAWLDSHGINHADISVNRNVAFVRTPDGMVIDYWMLLRNDVGSKYADPENPGEPAMEHRLTPCLSPPPTPKRSDLPTRAVLQCIADRTTLRDAVPLMEAINIPKAWDVLCEVYPEKVVAAAYERENDRDLLDYGVNITGSFLTAEGAARLIELGGQLHLGDRRPEA
ncbi:MULTISPECIES: hypothetical protein [unclassified Streptomyces]|uniref:hypothetical protein n=1 Tax=unclassified Streptomyces TaxID=2593676 RepID=UPI0036EB2C22